VKLELYINQLNAIDWGHHLVGMLKHSSAGTAQAQHWKWKIYGVGQPPDNSEDIRQNKPSQKGIFLGDIMGIWGIFWDNQWLETTKSGYSLVNCHITMENHHFIAG